MSADRRRERAERERERESRERETYRRRLELIKEIFVAERSSESSAVVTIVDRPAILQLRTVFASTGTTSTNLHGADDSGCLETGESNDRSTHARMSGPAHFMTMDGLRQKSRSQLCNTTTTTQRQPTHAAPVRGNQLFLAEWHRQVSVHKVGKRLGKRRVVNRVQKRDRSLRRKQAPHL